MLFPCLTSYRTIRQILIKKERNKEKSSRDESLWKTHWMEKRIREIWKTNINPMKIYCDYYIKSREIFNFLHTINIIFQKNPHN